MAVVMATHALQKGFGKTGVLDGLSLSVERGEIYGFLGRNGAGKSTTIRILMGVLPADRGEIELFGHRAKRPSKEAKRRIGYVSQEQHFYPWMTATSIGRFVAGFYPTWEGAEYLRLLQRFHLPDDRAIEDLSHGMRVKLALALALSHRPEILILDEPTAGLDPAARREFLHIVSQEVRAAGRTTFFSSHIVEEVERVVDRLGILERGQLRYQGSSEQLISMVRRVRGAEPPIPPGYQVLVSEPGALVLWAAPEIWAAGPYAPESIEAMSLEDAFLALTVGRVVG